MTIQQCHDIFSIHWPSVIPAKVRFSIPTGAWTNPNSAYQYNTHHRPFTTVFWMICVCATSWAVLSGVFNAALCLGSHASSASFKWLNHTGKALSWLDVTAMNGCRLRSRQVKFNRPSCSYWINVTKFDEHRHMRSGNAKPRARKNERRVGGERKATVTSVYSEGRRRTSSTGWTGR